MLKKEITIVALAMAMSFAAASIALAGNGDVYQTVAEQGSGHAMHMNGTNMHKAGAPEVQEQNGRQVKCALHTGLDYQDDHALRAEINARIDALECRKMKS